MRKIGSLVLILAASVLLAAYLGTASVLALWLRARRDAPGRGSAISR
jgi:hypothetical protein